MPIEGKLGSLYVNKEQTQPLFPRTKTKAITDDDNIRLDITLDSLKTTVNSKASEAFVMNAIANAQLGGGEGDIDLSGYATKDDISILATKEELNTIDYPVDSVNGKMGTVQLSAADVGARPNTWMPSASDVGAAPAGYGLGGYARDAKSLDEVTVSGFYQLAGSFMPDNNGWWGHANITSPNYGDVTCASVEGCVVRFNKYGGVWGPLEWVNPPMLPNTEYRTTERWNGAVVYTMLVNCGALPTSGTTQVSCFPGWYKIIRCEGSTSDGWAFPVLTSSGNCFVSACGNSIYFQTTRDLSNQTADVQLWYVK